MIHQLNKTVMKTTITNLGHEKVADFAGCIYVNYLVYMNGGFSGYDVKKLDATRERETKRVLSLDFDQYVDSIVKSIEKEPSTETERYFQREYKKWFLKS